MHWEELQQQWQRLDEKLEQSIRLETELLRHALLDPARRRVRRLAFWPALDIGFSAAVMIVTGAFLVGHWPDWRLVVPAAVILIAAELLLVDSIRQIVVVSEVDWSGPVADIQRALQRLRAGTVRQFKWIMLLSPLVGFCVFLVGIQWLLETLSNGRVNIVGRMDVGWMIGNYAFGVLFVPLGWLAARYGSRRWQGNQWWQRVLDDISGRTLRVAGEEVDRWACLQRDGEGVES